MAHRDFLGRMACSCCGLENGMRVAEDKNGAPFGFCDAGCGYQSRIGGDAERIEKFHLHHPEIRRVGVPVPVPDAVAMVTAPPVKGGGLSDALRLMGGGK